MPLDAFGREALQFGGAFSADSAVASFGGLAGGGVGLLTQSLSFTYAQKITRLFEIGSRFVFYIVGRSQGDAMAKRVLGPRPVSLAFYRLYGNPCTSGTLLFQVGVGCFLGDILGSLSFLLTGVILESITISIESAESMIVGEDLKMMFVTLII
jgi:hypothetical protein